MWIGGMDGAGTCASAGDYHDQIFHAEEVACFKVRHGGTRVIEFLRPVGVVAERVPG